MLFRSLRNQGTSSFPVTDHFDGRVFYNPGLHIDNSLFSLLKWKLTSSPATWPAAGGGMVRPEFPTRPKTGEMVVTFVGHATFLIQFAGLNILTDPVWSDRCSPVSWAGPKRVRPPALAMENLPKIDIVLLSHNHYDHCDLTTLSQLDSAHSPLILTGLGNRGLLHQHGLTHVQEADWWDFYALAFEFTDSGLSICFTPAQHWSNRLAQGKNCSLWGGFHLATSDRSLLFAGDSGYGPHFREIHDRLGSPDLALLPIGAYEPRWFMRTMHMNPAEAVQAHRDLHARRSLGMHYGTWQLTDEALEAPVQALAEAIQAAGLPPDGFLPAEFGRTLWLPFSNR